jgi:UDP-N-acetylmuramyl pentapeptide phosphotransferase/UDP-N-acetylglucosamine-1-phosphate transferase
MNLYFYITYIITCFFVLKIFRKKKILIDIKIEHHKSFSSKTLSNSLGGIFLIFFFIYYYTLVSLQITFIVYLFLFLSIGLFSDLKIINSVIIRFVLQTVLVIVFVDILNLKIITTKVDFFDELLKIDAVNIVFVSFCLLVLINGSNFIDGVNGLLIKYNLIIYIFLSYIFKEYQFIDNNFLNSLIFVLLVILVLNLSGLVYLGDSGAYLLSIFTGTYLINFVYYNDVISPYLIILLLWYPCFELLFSITRRIFLNSKSYKPDTNHLHHYIYSLFKKFNSLNNLSTHFLTSFLINFYNIIIFCIAANYIYSSKILVILILLNIIIYFITYVFLKKKFKKF